MHIDKLYFTLPEILERWQITEADLIYLAENDKLRLVRAHICQRYVHLPRFYIVPRGVAMGKGPALTILSR